ncbi:hypothetical protein SDC9_15162 [bioreactor metagenome]|uniref:BIG2 domain-containing protein n=1 Tax=bioreactor metagenome TaxID=1076179 RepID=A0A644TRC8_9ZZZZ|nr:hypothetical protein [Desulfitobacterium hafniense]MEA5023914.1 hypothetical protein [Desulfitobacterium hafniense]
MFNYFELNNPTDFKYLLYSAGQDITINGQPARALITNTNLTESRDNKKITTLENIERGFLIDYDNKKWLIVSGDNRYSRHKGIMQRCNNTLIVNVGGILYKVPCIVTNKVNLNIDTTTYISSLDNEIYILVANDSLNSNIKLNDIYKIGQRNYKVRNIDDIGQSGLLYIKLEFSESPQVLPVYSISITNGDTLTTNVETPVQLTIEQKDGDTVLTNPLPMVFVSSNESIAMVDNNGLVSPVSVGEVVISVSIESDPSVNDSISITIEEMPVIETFILELTGSISPDTEIKQNQTKTYTCVKKNSLGVTVEGAQFDFSINPGTTPTSAYVFTVVNDTQCTIKGNSSTYYIDLVATDRADNTLSVTKNIKLRPLF